MSRMERDGTKFKQEAPESPPTITVHASIMHHAHKSFGKVPSGAPSSPTDISTQAFTGICAQTCTSGPDILQKLQCLTSCFVTTSQSIHGVINNALGIAGALLLQIKTGTQ